MKISLARTMALSLILSGLMVLVPPGVEAQDNPQTSLPAEMTLSQSSPEAVAVFADASEDSIAAGPIIAIDIGHTPRTGGARSASGELEYHFNHTIAHLLQRELHHRGFPRAFIMNATGAEISLTDRTAMATRHQADLLLSIHHDSVQPQYLSTCVQDGTMYRYCDRFAGYSLFISPQNGDFPASQHCALLIGRQLRADGFLPAWHHEERVKGENRAWVDRDTGVHLYDGLVVLKTAPMPAVLIECGVLVHRGELALLKDSQYRQDLVVSIGAAIEQFFSSQPQP